MKLSKAEVAIIEEIKTQDISTAKDIAGDIKFLVSCIDRLQSKPHRFTYEMRDCKQCDGVGEVGASMNQFACDVEKCKACGGLGKIRTKVARK